MTSWSPSRSPKTWGWGSPCPQSCGLQPARVKQGLRKTNSRRGQPECTKIAHRRSLAIFTADEGIARNSAARINFKRFHRRKNRGSLAIFFAEEIAHLSGCRKRSAAKGVRSLFFVFGTLSVTFRSLFLTLLSLFSSLFCQTPFAGLLLRQGESWGLKTQRTRPY